MSKGSKPRPFSVDQETYAANFDRIFGQPGSGVMGSAPDSNSGGSGSAPDSPAIYIDNCTGRQVTEDYWPGDPIPEQA